MNTKRTMATVVTMVLFALGVMTVAASGEEVGSTATKEVPAAAQTSGPVATVVYDETSDVANPKLDIRKVKVVNTTSRVKVKVFFPGVAKTYDFPLGAVSVFLDTEAQRAGPEYGHFMDFFSDYRFAVTDRWRENPTPEWGHSPEGACVETAGVRSDKQSKLRWFQYVVRKTEGCFEAEAVRVAVTTINTGDLKPTIYYDRPFYDHLSAKHAWSDWIPVA